MCVYTFIFSSGFAQRDQGFVDKQLLRSEGDQYFYFDSNVFERIRENKKEANA